jgi:hypothetical protein
MLTLHALPKKRTFESRVGRKQSLFMYDRAKRTLLSIWQWLLEQHRISERMLTAIAARRTEIDRLLR